jgi:hypothetical protein
MWPLKALSAMGLWLYMENNVRWLATDEDFFLKV